MNIFVIGGLCTDSVIRVNKLPEPKEQTIFSKKFFESIGGTGAIKSLNLSRLGFKVTFHSQIGNDKYLNFYKKYFSKNRIKFIPHIEKSETEKHVNIVDDDGNRVSIYAIYSSFNPEINYSKIEKEIKKADIIALNIINYCRNIIPLAKKYNKPIWCDIHDYDGNNDYHKDFINAANVIFMCSSGMNNWKDFMISMIDQGKDFVVCTHGKNGVSAFNKNKEWITLPVIEEYSNNFVDSNGAGDSFFAGFLYGFCKGLKLKECLKYGTINGGLCVTTEKPFYEKLSVDMIETEFKKYFINN